MKNLLKGLLLGVLMALTAAATASEQTTNITAAVTAFEQGDLGQAKDLFTAEKEQPLAQFYLGRISLKQADYGRAEKYFNQLVEIDPENAEYHYYFASSHLQLAANASIFSAPGHASTAREHFEKALKLKPDYVHAMQGLIGFYTHAPAIAGGSRKKALAMARQLSQVSALHGLISEVNVYRANDDNKNELIAANKLLEQFPQSSRALTKAGFTFQGQEDFEKALSVFSQAARQKDEDGGEFPMRALYQVGRTAAFSGKFTDEGISALHQYIDTPTSASLPSKNWARYRLASLLKKNGRLEEAAELAQIAAKDPDEKQLRRNASQLLKSLN